MERDVDLKFFYDMETAGGGWTVFQRRIDGTEDFYFEWFDYEVGFGDLRKEFWIGNAKLHMMTSSNQYTLRIDLGSFDNQTRYAEYGTFSISGADDKYRLRVAAYSGDAGDQMNVHDGRQFTTKDQDNDLCPFNCAERYSGAWWFNNCHDSHLNGEYLEETHSAYSCGLIWYGWTGHYTSLKSSKMMIRRDGSK